MSRGPGGEKRPTDVIGCAIPAPRLSVQDAHEESKEPSGKVSRGYVGAEGRAKPLTAEQRKEIARTADSMGWR